MAALLIPLFMSARPRVTTLIAGAFGTPIGDMTSNGGLAAAFDGNSSQAAAASARGIISTPYGSVGKNWGAATKIITKYIVKAPTDVGFSATGAATITFSLYGGSSTPGTWNNTGSGGTLLHNAAAQANTIGGTITFTSITTTTGYLAHWVQSVASSGANEEYMCELELYEDV